VKAQVLTGIRQFELVDLPKPEIAKDKDILLKVEAVGVCGSDIHYYQTGRIGSQVVKYPFVVGHECAGSVEAVGRKVAGIRVGDRVAVDPAIACQICDQCKQGRENTCRNLKFLGCPGQIDGCLCEYIVMPQRCCIPIGAKLNFSQAVLCEPLSIGLHAVRKAELTQHADVAILGSGPIGLSCLVTAKAEGINNIYVTEKIAERMQAAKENGAKWTGNPNNEDIIKEILGLQPTGMDVVFECAGQQETIDQAVDLLKPGGKLMLIGIPREERISLVIDKIRRKEITLINVRRQNKCIKACIDLIACGKVTIDFMITHRFKLQQAKQAFDIVSGYREGVIKALIEI